jgi:hypothetical protein
MPQLRKRTTSHDWILKRETLAKELGVGQSEDGTRDWLVRKVALRRQLNVTSHLALAASLAREGSTRDGGGKSSQDWEGENPHSVWLGRKERGG